MEIISKSVIRFNFIRHFLAKINNYSYINSGFKLLSSEYVFMGFDEFINTVAKLNIMAVCCLLHLEQM